MIIDAHLHMWLRDHLPDAMVRMYLEPLDALKELMDWEVDTELAWPEYTVGSEKALETMDAGGIDMAIVLPIDFNLVEAARIDVLEYNTWVFEECSRYPDRFVPFIGVDPLRGEGALKILEHFTKRYDAKGVKLYPSTGWYPNDGRLVPFFDAIEDLGLHVLSHTGAAWGSLEERFSEPKHWNDLLERHPGTNVVLAHLGGRWREQTFEMCQEHPNCFTDISALQGWLPSNPEIALSRLEEVAEKVPDKACFGSDFPLFELSYTTSSWAHFVRSQPWAGEQVRENVLGNNVRRAFGL